MIKAIIVVRKPGRLETDYSMPFDLPALPRDGDYISVFPSGSGSRSDDLIVRKVWWHLSQNGTAENPGKVLDINVECDVALGPYASIACEQTARSAEAGGYTVERFNVARIVGPGD